MKTWKPLGHRVLIRPEKITNEIRTETGVKLYAPDQVVDMEKAGNNRGVVIAIGKFCWKHDQLGNEPWCSVGDTVIWPRYAGGKVKWSDGEEYFLVNDEDLLAVEVEGENE